MGTQDDFAFAQEFVDSGGLTDTPTTFLWEPGFQTWRSFEVSRNSTMTLVSPDLSTIGQLFVGFGEAQQQEVLAALADFR